MDTKMQPSSPNDNGRKLRLALVLGLACVAGAARAEMTGGPSVISPLSLKLTLPKGWVEHPNPGGPREFHATPDGSTGILQVSEMPASQAQFIRDQADLGAMAAAIGAGLGKKHNWGKLAGNKQGECAMGRYGFAMFVGGMYPEMLLWLTASKTGVWMWTWLGPEPASKPVEEAVHIVLETPAPH